MSSSPIDQAILYLHQHLAGEFRFDEHVRPMKVVVGPSGDLVAPVMVAMIEAADTVLFLPEDSEHALQVQVTVVPFKESGPEGALADRWRIYHGEPEDLSWAHLSIDAARYDGHVIDGEALMCPNAIAAEEARLCTFLNGLGADTIHRICQRDLGVEIEQPVVVGVDQFGFDVRGRFSVFRVPSPRPMNTAAEAEATLRAILEGPDRSSMTDQGV